MPEIEEVCEMSGQFLGGVVIYGKEPYLIVGLTGDSFVCGNHIHVMRDYEVMTLSLENEAEQDMAYKPFYLLTLDLQSKHTVANIISWADYIRDWRTDPVPINKLGGVDDNDNITVGLRGHQFVTSAGEIVTVGKQTDGTRMVLPLRRPDPHGYRFRQFTILDQV